jgi:hypothetical protein
MSVAMRSSSGSGGSRQYDRPCDLGRYRFSRLILTRSGLAVDLRRPLDQVDLHDGGVRVGRHPEGAQLVGAEALLDDPSGHAELQPGTARPAGGLQRTHDEVGAAG